MVSSKAGPEQARRAADIAERWGMEVVPRDAVAPGETVLVVARDGLRLQRDGVTRGWHPGLLHTLREAGDRHPLVRCAGLKRGDRVLDCTLGFGTDAWFLSEVTGTTVVGLEAVPAIGLLAAEGLARSGADVEVVIAEAAAYLDGAGDGAFDVVCADPMFPPAAALARDAAGSRAPSLEAVRWIACPTRPDAAWLAQALRVARRAVIVRDAHPGDLLEALGAPRIHGRPGRRARYGVWRTAAPCGSVDKEEI